MDCHEIRQLIPPVARGETTLTEWALVEAHVKHCRACRAQQERVERGLDSRPVVLARAFTDSLTGLGGRIRGRARSGDYLGRPFRGRVPAAVRAASRTPGPRWATTAATHALEPARQWATVTATHALVASRAILARGDRLRGTLRLKVATVAASVGQGGRDLGAALAIAHARVRRGAHAAIGRGRVHAARARTGLRAQLALARPHAVRIRAATVAALHRGRLHGADAWIALRPHLALARPHAARIRAATVAALHRGRLHGARAGAALSSEVSLARVRATQAGREVVAASREALTRAGRLRPRIPDPLSILHMKTVQVAGIALMVVLALYALLPARPDLWRKMTIGPREPTVEGKVPRGLEAAVPPAASTTSVAATTSAQKPRPGGPHVVGRLTVKDRHESEREITDLLVRAGGAQVGGRHDLAMTVVDALVPSSGYREFVRGLTQIGFWQVEAERTPLPRGVRMTIRMAD